MEKTIIRVLRPRKEMNIIPTAVVTKFIILRINETCNTSPGKKLAEFPKKILTPVNYCKTARPHATTVALWY